MSSAFASRRDRRTADALSRKAEARQFQQQHARPSSLLERELVRVQELLADELSTLAYRRVCELAIADYIESWASTLRWQALAQRMRGCHVNGSVHLYYTVGDPEQIYGHLIMWDHKCGETQLCPHEARENQQRLAKKYVAAMLEWKAERPGRRRIFTAVISPPNVPVGELWQSKRELMARFATWLRQSRDVTDADRKRYGWTQHKKKMPRWLAPDRDARGARAEGIHGAFVHQEDPLSRIDDWNVHLNVLFLVEGKFDYRQIQAEWGCQVKIRDLEAQPAQGSFDRHRRRKLTSEDLRLQMLEVVKYAAELVASKSDRKGEAPPLVQWPPERFREWYRGQKPRQREDGKRVGSFRRTRTYGCLHGVPDPEPDFDLDLTFPVGEIVWTGRAYGVSLIPADNFPSSNADKRHQWGVHDFEARAPPLRAQHTDR